ncbi:MAG: XTP/dITP diphosphatase [Deltaproteobacteria bacterium]|nr:XTP/dITP diphosphatase [Deltaproteobacteria bacterium]
MPGSSSIVLATANRHKIEEMVVLFSALPWRFVSLADYPAVVLPAEIGATFRANARLKAEAVSRATGCPALADDSGLCVDALGGGPGVRSARYAGAEGNATANIAKLLAALRATPPAARRAHFVCVMALASPDGKITFTEGRCDGMIAEAPRGAGGFGYDPVFYLPLYGCTMAELPAEEKNRISHRARAAKEMAKEMAKTSA